MPITSSAKKALRQSKKHREENLKRSEAFKSAIKKFKKLVEAKKLDEAKASLPTVFQALDKATKTNVIKKNTASRLKSRLSKKLFPKS
jgi:small subunit ribosomal protein S20